MRLPDQHERGKKDLSQKPFKAAYTLLDERHFSEKIAQAHESLADCTLCPRHCRVDRTAGRAGFCRTGDQPFVSSWGPHFGEERPLVGTCGSGTIFFGNCNLGCIFCQNYSISHLGEGIEMSCEKLAAVMVSLQAGGCHNINLVTPSHQVPPIMQAIRIASGKGLAVPIVYNCGGYEEVGTLKLLDGIIDIYMPDFKYADHRHAAHYSGAEDYPEKAKAALREMHRQVGDLLIDENGIALRGLLVRHLVLPGGISGTAAVVAFIAEEISRETYINIMDQYHPCFKASGEPPLDRRITKREYEEALQSALDAGLKRIDGVTV